MAKMILEFMAGGGKWFKVLLILAFGVVGPTWAANSPEPTEAETVRVESAPSEDNVLSLALLSETQVPLLDQTIEKITRLTLKECVERALLHNLDIRASSYDPAIRLSDVVEAEAAFDAVLFSAAEYANTDRANNSTEFFNRTVVGSSGTTSIPFATDPYRRSHDGNYSLGLRQRLATGATMELAQKLRRFRNITDEDDLYYKTFYEYDLQLKLRQPLLRDFGIDINRANIYANRNNYEISKQQFHLKVIETAFEVEQNYWSLLLARQQVKIFEGLHKQARLTLEKLERRRSRDTNTEVFMQSQALMERAKANIISSLSRVRQQQDRLLESINDPGLPLDTALEIVPLDEPTNQAYEVEMGEAQQLALQVRPEIVSQRLRLENAGIGVGVAKNQLLPRLDLIFQQDATGAGLSDDRAWDHQRDYDTISQSVGLSFEIPLGNRASEAFYTKAKHQRRQEQYRLASMRDLVLAELNISVHRVRDTYHEIGAEREAAVAESNILEAYLAMDKADQGTTPGMLDRKLRAQERLANALLSVAQTKVEYNLSIVAFQRAQGTLLRYNNIKLTEFDEPEW